MKTVYLQIASYNMNVGGKIPPHMMTNSDSETMRFTYFLTFLLRSWS